MQGQCAACYAFSAVGALEGAYALAHDELVTLSEQNIIDCSGEPHMIEHSRCWLLDILVAEYIHLE